MVQRRITNNNHYLSRVSRNSPGLSGAVLKQKQPLRQDFLSNQFAKGSLESSGRRGGGEAGAGREGNQGRVWWRQFCRKLAAPDPLGTSGCCPPLMQGAWAFSLHTCHHWPFPTLDSRVWTPRHACLYRYRSRVPFRLLLTSVSWSVKKEVIFISTLFFRTKWNYAYKVIVLTAGTSVVV